ncbi:MAG: hypothetical protein KDD66_18240, partial [Bdellovibrionales bacterium]|nr:hypothetical protein [Bdellovibrionales bacterium]
IPGVFEDLLRRAGLTSSFNHSYSMAATMVNLHLKICVAMMFYFIALPSAAFAGGKCVEGTCEEGMGKLIMSNGIVYHGNFKGKKFNGKGTMEYPDGAKYDGDFTDGEQDGYGKMTYKDGSEYEGEWRMRKRHGQGTMKYKDGSEYKGTFEYGRAQGYGTIEWPNGKSFSGQFKNGQPVNTPKKR